MHVEFHVIRSSAAGGGLVTCPGPGVLWPNQAGTGSVSSWM